MTRAGAAVLLSAIAATSASLSCGTAVQWQVRRLARDNPQVLYSVETSIKAVALTRVGTSSTAGCGV